jgi:hypothetical protein
VFTADSLPFVRQQNQGSLTEGEGSALLIS